MWKHLRERKEAFFPLKTQFRILEQGLVQKRKLKHKSEIQNYIYKLLLHLKMNDCTRGLLEWHNPRDSGVVFGAVLVVLLSLRYVSALSVLGHLALGLITATMAFRIYKSVLAAVNKSGEGHPFRVSNQNSFGYILYLCRGINNSNLNLMT